MEILLIEDNQSDVFLFKMFLEDIGADARLVVFNDGVSAMEYLSKVNLDRIAPMPDLIVLDINLPDGSGFEILAEIKMNYLLHNLKVIMLTTSSENEDKAYAKQLGAYDFFTKPIDISEYERTVKLICNYAGKNHQLAV